MALNFNLLNTELPNQIASSFQQGYQGAQDRANVLAQRQQQRQIADMEMQNALRVQQNVDARRAAYGETNPMEIANKLRSAGLGEEALKIEQQSQERIAESLREGAKSIAMSPLSYKSIFQRARQTLGIPLDDDEKRYDEAFATGGESAIRKLAAADAGLGMQVFGGSMYDPSTGKVITPPKERASTLLTPEEEAQQVRIAKAKQRPLAGSDGATVGVKPVTSKTESVVPNAPFLTRKEMEKREASMPKATQSVKIVGNTMSVIEETVDRLIKNKEGLNGITGLIYGNTPPITDAARQAQADLNQLKNLAFVQGLTELREASKTGAGVGSVSNKEGERFENLKASLERTQSVDSLRQALLRLKGQAGFTKQSMQEAFDETYQYRNNEPVNKSTPMPANIDALLDKYK